MGIFHATKLLCLSACFRLKKSGFFLMFCLGYVLDPQGCQEASDEL